jgi:AcrR family transcriptional regulator
VAALARLAASEGYEELTVSKIRKSAGASSKKFTTHFTGVADCFQEVVELYVSKGLLRLGSEHGVKGSCRTVNEAMAILCERVERDSTFAVVCFADVFASGPAGVQSLDRLIKEMASFFSEDNQRTRSALCITREAGAGAVWGAIREEIIRRRRSRVREIAPLLRVFVEPPTGLREDGKHSGSKFDQSHHDDDARSSRGVSSSALAVTTK